MLPISFKINCLQQIEERLTLPKSNYFVRNESSIRLCYYKRQRIKYINLPTHEEVAVFLKRHGVIRFYSLNEGKVTMYQAILHTITGERGQPIQYERMV